MKKKFYITVLIMTMFSKNLSADIDINSPDCFDNQECVSECLKDKACNDRWIFEARKVAAKQVFSLALDDYNNGKIEKAIKSLKILTDSDLKYPIEAYYVLGTIYIDKNQMEEAKKVLNAGSKLGSGDSEIYLSIVYEKANQLKKAKELILSGYNKPHTMEDKDYNEHFLRISKKLALAGDLATQIELGTAYIQNEQYEEANKWLTLAANQKYYPAMNLLGLMYQHGLAVKQDKIIAYALYSVSAQNDSSRAPQANLDKINSSMNQDELIAAKKLALHIRKKGIEAVLREYIK